MTMVSYPAAIPIASAVAAPSPSSLNSKAGSGTTRGSVVATAQPEKDQEDEQEAAVPPPLDPALLTAPSTTINHLCSARLRLMTSLPSVGIAWSLWCGQCGALRDADTSSRPKKRSSDGVIKEDDGNSYDTMHDELERELEKSLAAALSGVDDSLVKTPPPARKPQRPRRMPTCSNCGAKFRRPNPRPPPYPSARSVARTRRASSLAQCVKAEPEPERVLSPAGTVDVAELFGEDTSAAASSNGDGDASVASPYPYALARTPSLAHISSSDPATPTYPKPSNAPPPQSGGAAVPVKLPTSPPPAKKRKTKKSGLAKLLAQNAQREKEKSDSGSWGLE